MRDRSHTAHHEAAHAVIHYRVGGYCGGPITIAPNAEENYAGRYLDQLSDDHCEKDAYASILSCYAGGFADRKTGSYEEWRLLGDEDGASEIIQQWEWESREAEFRDEARRLVDLHWPEIQAVAAELLERETLDNDEVMIIADVAAGIDGVSLWDLQMYRRLKDRT